MSSAYYKGLKRDAEAKKRKYEKRLKEVNEIIGKLSSVPGDWVSDVNNKIQKTADELENGIKNISHITQVADEMISKKESESDSNISSAKISLSSEVSVINQNIADLNAEINNLNVTIAAEEERERQEREEALKKLLGIKK